VSRHGGAGEDQCGVEVRVTVDFKAMETKVHFDPQFCLLSEIARRRQFLWLSVAANQVAGLR
jgi:hypothetical protein